MAGTYEQTPASKADLLQQVQDAHDALEGTVALLNHEQTVQPVLEGGRSVKDVLAHITAWEQLMLTWLRGRARGETPDMPELGLDYDGLDELNERLYGENRDRSLQEVRVAFNDSYQQVLEELEATPEEVLFDPSGSGWQETQPLWVLVATNTSRHYQEHAEAIEAWTERSKSEAHEAEKAGE
jgi:hypothetical protein